MARDAQSKAVREVDKMAMETIKEVVAANPSARFFHTTPAMLEAQGSKRNRSTMEAEEVDNNKENRSLSKKTARMSIENEDSSDDLDDPPAFEFTIHPHLIKNSAPTAVRNGHNARKASKEEFMELPPFSLSSKRGYAGLLTELSAALKCSILDIDEHKISWKKKIPVNHTRSLMGKEVGWKDILTQLKATKADKRSIMIYLPVPRRNLPEDDYDIDFDPSVSTTASIAEQQTTFDKTIRGHMEQLEATYPIGNHKLFPTKRVYTQSSSGFCWELTTLGMQSWANHLVCGLGTATLEQPPAVSHFDINQRIKVIPRPPQAPESTLVTADPAAPASTAPTPMTGLFGSSVQLGELLAFGMVSNMLSHSIGGNAVATAFPGLAGMVPPVRTAPAPTASTVGAEPLSTVSLPPSPDVALKVDVPLASFCTRYGLLATVSIGLSKLGYTPGDSNLRRTDVSHWHDYAGIPPLLWDRVLKAHRQFIVDVQEGLWAEFAIA
ncbi:hypothetical protein K435DRAFT_853070 [Dendrothele bispora CBS 962.96]|uniref:Uncharacterized protein n=1 Tax=Dendrothele bispora (strain CBS 962.96) TaxID=1314807 RepID=A0A4S8KZB9_DENBC|nr:hypothetical protein K435DRAFT_873438 [Dendrothele bispora CBS 962.96]THV02097.1 hypothetical protein K435DRAFT_853070 [Dendrothele bispora CBS 962.96]